MTKTKIIPERLERLMGKDFHLRNGSGKGINGNVDACIMQAVDWLAGGTGASDSPECAAPMITRYCIRLNDSRLFAKHRDLLKPFAAKIVNTRNPKKDRKRAYIAADYAVRVFLPIRLRYDPKKRFDAFADELEALPQIKNKTSAKNGETLARKVRAAADADAATATVAAAATAAYAAAHAATYAAAAAYAYAVTCVVTYAAAHAYAYAYAAAYAAAHAATYAAAAADADAATAIGDQLRTKSLECLTALIEA